MFYNFSSIQTAAENENLVELIKIINFSHDEKSLEQEEIPAILPIKIESRRNDTLSQDPNGKVKVPSEIRTHMPEFNKELLSPYQTVALWLKIERELETPQLAGRKQAAKLVKGKEVAGRKSHPLSSVF